MSERERVRDEEREREREGDKKSERKRKNERKGENEREEGTHIVTERVREIRKTNRVID